MVHVLLKTLRKTVRHKDATIFRDVYCVSLSIFNVLAQSFSVLKFLPKIWKDRYLKNENSYRADFTDSDTVYGSDDGLKRKST